MIQVQPLFASFAAIEKIEVDNESIKQYIYDLEKKDPKGRLYSNVGGWQSQFLDLKEPILKDLIDKVTNVFNEVAISLQFVKKQYTLNTAWANVNRKFNYNSMHYHPTTFLAGVYYVNGSEEMGQLKFQSPVPYADLFYEPEVPEFNEFNSVIWTMPCETGALIIFPAWLYHDVTPNLTDEDRISIAFNLNR